MIEGVSKGTAVVTGASSGVGACYAEQLAERGYDVIMIARNRARMNTLASQLTDKTGRSFEVVQADLARLAGVQSVESLLRSDSSITMLVNNAGIGAAAPMLESDTSLISPIIAVNLAALTRFTRAVAPAFASRGTGTIIQVATVANDRPECKNGMCEAIAAYVLAYSRSLHQDFSDQGIRLQVVLPESKYRRFLQVTDHEAVRGRVSYATAAENMVRTALAGLDHGEFVSMASSR
ncbi:SDR family NAD(P)-dependent oxidoreductase [Burkholderia sp. Ac-20365]|uniref:SDR family NAD(P)-dependent oxidoreductase n=1 Tax=Burkholderia sp. Ac-20365 TaxID=2703897 RepID=UPI00197B373C|nr:SDR family NAD(P)-dependent oxidoreductase [Burkholderia sp. Ac-20365]MBN3761421.1 SDR family NAD(P)-dependent oxidoreductase [Burkholderia sp. Ac-20365]